MGEAVDASQRTRYDSTGNQIFVGVAKPIEPIEPPAAEPDAESTPDDGAGARRSRAKVTGKVVATKPIPTKAVPTKAPTKSPAKSAKAGGAGGGKAGTKSSPSGAKPGAGAA